MIGLGDTSDENEMINQQRSQFDVKVNEEWFTSTRVRMKQAWRTCVNAKHQAPVFELVSNISSCFSRFSSVKRNDSDSDSTQI